MVALWYPCGESKGCENSGRIAAATSSTAQVMTSRLGVVHARIEPRPCGGWAEREPDRPNPCLSQVSGPPAPPNRGGPRSMPVNVMNRPGESGDFVVWGLSRRLVSGVERSRRPQDRRVECRRSTRRAGGG